MSEGIKFELPATLGGKEQDRTAAGSDSLKSAIKILVDANAKLTQRTQGRSLG
jgi:hypothetical protein